MSLLLISDKEEKSYEKATQISFSYTMPCHVRCYCIFLLHCPSQSRTQLYRRGLPCMSGNSRAKKADGIRVLLSDMRFFTVALSDFIHVLKKQYLTIRLRPYTYYRKS